MTKRKKVASAGEIRDGEMKEVEVGETPVLLVKTGGKIRAMSACCTHYGAPLVDGVCSDGRIVCPWHHACFCMGNGDLVNPPALDALSEYEVETVDGDVYVHLPDEPEGGEKPVKPKEHYADTPVYVVLGGGAAGAVAVETLRRDGIKGRIILVSKEYRLPYDRTVLSKSYMATKNDKDYVPIRQARFYERLGIEVLLGKTVVRVDAENRRIHIRNGEEIPYDSLLLATGGAPRTLDIDGASLEDVFTLRTPPDADRIIAAAGSGRRAVVVGASFIAMECAANLRKRDVEVSVVAPEEVPFEKTLGRELGSMFRKLHEANGVEFHLGTTVERIEGKTRVEQVRLENGEKLDADFVLFGVGVKPVTDYLEGVEKNKDGSVNVDKYFRVKGHDNLYAAGDIARFPEPVSGKPARIEHWRVAQMHGMYAAHTMAGEELPFHEVPFFWSGQYDLKLRYVGHAEDWDRVDVAGDLDEQDFIAYYVKDDQVLAAAGASHDAEMAAIEECMRRGCMPDARQVSGETFNWKAHLSNAQ